MRTRCVGVWPRLRGALVLVVGGLVLSCGGAAPPHPPAAPAPSSEAAPAGTPAEETQSLPAAAPQPAPASEPARVTTQDALESGDELARAERELAAADRELSTDDAKAGASEGERRDDAPGRGSGAGAGAAKPKASAPAKKSCDTTCRAFASLVRARDSICRIDGDDGERCSRANQIVEHHTARSTSCGCGS